MATTKKPKPDEAPAVIPEVLPPEAAAPAVKKEDAAAWRWTEGANTKTKQILRSMHKAFPKAQVMGTAAAMAVESVVTPSGSVAFDWGVGKGGLLQNKIIELYGPPSQGKTLISLQMIVATQKSGKHAVYCDVERSHDEKDTQAWMRSQGVDIENLIYIRNTAELTMDQIHFLCEHPDVGLIVLDSVAGLVLDQVVYKDDMGKQRMRTIANLLPTFLGKFNVLTKGATLLVINQVRAAMGQGAGSYVVYDTPCGYALKHLAHARVEVRGERLTDEIADPSDSKAATIKVQIGIEITMRFMKNKMAPPFKRAIVRYYFATGVDTVDEMVNLGFRQRLFTVNKSWVSFSGPGFDLRENGHDNFVLSLRQCPQAHKYLREKILAAVDSTADFSLTQDEMAQQDGGL